MSTHTQICYIDYVQGFVYVPIYFHTICTMCEYVYKVQSCTQPCLWCACACACVRLTKTINIVVVGVQLKESCVGGAVVGGVGDGGGCGGGWWLIGVLRVA